MYYEEGEDRPPAEADRVLQNFNDTGDGMANLLGVTGAALFWEKLAPDVLHRLVSQALGEFQQVV